MSGEDRRSSWRRGRALGLGVALAALVVLGLGVLTFFKTGQSDFAGYLVLLGAVVTAALSLLAAWISDRRLRQEAVQTNDRLHQEAVQANERLRLEAAMQAGSLLTAAPGTVVSSATIVSSLLALTRLDRTELAVALLVDLWSGTAHRTHRVCSEAAILVIDAALRDTSGSNAPLIAAELLCRNAERLDAAQSLHWPSCIDGGWRSDFSPQTKLLIIDGLVTMTTTSAAVESALRALVVRLHGIWTTDPDPHVKGCTALLICAVLDKVRSLGYTNFMHASFDVSLENIESAVLTPEPADSDEYLVRLSKDRAGKLKAWSMGCVRSFENGALGNSSSGRAVAPSRQGLRSPAGGR